MGANYLLVEFPILKYISLNLSIQLSKLGLVCILIIDHILED